MGILDEGGMDMIVSTKGRYAIRAMADIALYEKKGPVSLTEVANRQDISQKYLEAVIRPLNQAGFLKSKMGKHGGYQLTRNPKEYTLLEIFETAEDTLAPVSCLEDGGPNCDRKGQCLTLPVWMKLDDLIEGFFGKLTLEDVIEGKIDTEEIGK